MKTALLALLCLAVACPAVAGLKQDVEELYRPADAQTVKSMTILPPYRGHAAAKFTEGGGHCPQDINIGAAQSQQNRIQRFDATVVINAPVVIQCR